MYVYKTTNLINGKKYIGVSVSKDLKKREWYLGSGILLKLAIKKYGKDNFKKEIIKEFITEKEARDYERYLIDKLNAINDEKYYNLVAGGYGGSVSKHIVSEETRRKISEGRKGIKLSEKQILSMSKPILKYDLYGNFISEYPSKAKAILENGIYMPIVYGDKLTYIKGFLWIYKNGEIEKKVISREELIENHNDSISKTVGKLSKDDVLNLIRDREFGLTYQQLGDKYGITKSCAYEIVIGKTYKWVWKDEIL